MADFLLGQFPDGRHTVGALYVSVGSCDDSRSTHLSWYTVHLALVLEHLECVPCSVETDRQQSVLLGEWNKQLT